MSLTPSGDVHRLSQAFAAACRGASSETDLFSRCRDIVAQHTGHDALWFALHVEGVAPQLFGPGAVHPEAVEVLRSPTERGLVVLLAAPDAIPSLKPYALALSVSLAVVLELRECVVGAPREVLTTATHARALRQVTRLLSSIESLERTERAVVDFLGQVAAAHWAALYRQTGRAYLAEAIYGEGHAPPLPGLDAERLHRALAAHEGVAPVVPSEMRPAVAALLPLDAGGERMGLLALGPRADQLPHSPADLQLYETLATAGAMALKNAELVERLKNAATTDELTGLLNRRALEERLGTEITRSVRHHLSTSIVLLDLDGMKRVNDTHGHAAGDRLLVLVANVLRRECRSLDVVGRLGGDEFLVVLPMTTADEARVFVHRVQAGLGELEQRYPEFAPCAASTGIAQAPRHGTTPADLLEAADRALYAAKRAGGNAVELAARQ